MRWIVVACMTLSCRSASTAGAGEAAGASGDLAHGIDLVEHGELEAGIESLRALVRESSDRALVAQARCWIASALTRGGDPESALRECRLAIELAPGDPWPHYASGVAFYTMGELDDALAAFTRGLELDPRHIKCLQWRGLVLRDMDEDRAAVESLTRALECIESADDATLASWGGDRRTLLLKTLNLRLQSLDDLGLHEEATLDRARIDTILDGGVPAPEARVR